MHIFSNILNPFASAMAVSSSPWPRPWQFWPHENVTQISSGFMDLHRLLVCVLGLVLVGFLVLLGVILLKFRASRHPRPEKAGGPFLEYALVGLPIVLLVLVAVPALRQQALAGDKPVADIAVTVVGEAGAWRYAYPGDGAFSFLSHRLSRAGAAARHQPYGFAVTAPLVVPVGKTIALTLTSADMLYSWSVPAFGVQGVAAPGQLTHIWFHAQRTGIYYGLCSALCGDYAEEMPVAVQVVSLPDYRRWLHQALLRYSGESRKAMVSVGEGAS